MSFVIAVQQQEIGFTIMPETFLMSQWATSNKAKVLRGRLYSLFTVSVEHCARCAALLQELFGYSSKRCTELDDRDRLRGNSTFG